jgi:hypothetical protein
MTKYFLCSFVILLISCRSDYAGLRTSRENKDCSKTFANNFRTSWYTASVDVYGRHLSGLLLIKDLEDGKYRTVFTNEAGISLFDFEFSEGGALEVKRVVKQLDRKAVINTLADDFALLLRMPFKGKSLVSYETGDELLYAAVGKNDIAYLVTDRECSSLRRLEIGSKRSRKVSILLKGEYFQPENIEIDHHNFKMTIRLKKIAGR